MSHSSIYARDTDLVVRKVGDEAILVPVRNRVGDLDSVVTLNESALSVWNLLDGKRSVSEIAAAVTSEYDVPPAVAAADVSELLGELEAAGLVHPIEDPS